GSSAAPARGRERLGRYDQAGAEFVRFVAGHRVHQHRTHRARPGDVYSKAGAHAREPSNAAASRGIRSRRRPGGPLAADGLNLSANYDKLRMRLRAVALPPADDSLASGTPAIQARRTGRSGAPIAGHKEPKMEQKLKIAVFIDFDNIEIGVKSTLHREFDVAAVLDALKERGEIVTKIAYANWGRQES